MLIAGTRQGVSCRDLLGELAEIQVQLDDSGYVVLVTPQREHVRLTDTDSALLRAALADAESQGRDQWLW
jgi:hypothetical protein